MSNFILKTLETRELKLNTIRLRGFYGGKLRKGSGGGGSGDGFPQLPGDVTRWHFGGLTNEMMAAMDDPRIEDADHKGRFLSFKNFAWKEGSGISDIYPGALVFDGVDDYGVCDNFPILTKEKGYTVVALRQWITYNQNAIFAIATNASDQSFNGAFTFEYLQKGLERTISYGSTQISLSYSKSPFSWQTTSKYNGVDINNGNKEATNSLALGRAYPQRNESANFAIWELVFLDHDATEEELAKIKDYFVKTYPWLFLDQAWTVTGKTNEDEDRATIANITGNGNDLVLSNFGFIEGSGYNEEGEYAGYLVTDGVDDKIASSAFEMGEDFTVVGEWKLLPVSSYNYAGIVKSNNLYVYNNASIGLAVFIRSGGSVANKVEGIKSLKAICSDGRVYGEDWTEYKLNPGTTVGANTALNLGFNGSNFTQMAFKNLGIYNNQILSKNDCIKAYNYLQTLKAK
ncbi:hypothetical protein [Parabacteroides johnsonii]|uniref:hypothetical protein n=1 Tax=Parabacteroides johnsonii TaxID=387661 RepID=UPI0011DCDCE8|nr:hypothetical protein [Parabacteroides johnsonii]